MARTKQEESTRDEVLGKEGPARSGKVFEMDERTARFGEDIIGFALGLKRDPVNTPLISQLVRAGPSVGANYTGAGAAQSGRDFDHKIGICKKEARETMHWLRMLVAADDSARAECRALWREAPRIDHDLLSDSQEAPGLTLSLLLALSLVLMLRRATNV